MYAVYEVVRAGKSWRSELLAREHGRFHQLVADKVNRVQGTALGKGSGHEDLAYEAEKYQH